MSELSNIEIHRLVADLLDPKDVVAFRPALARALGATAALFLCQAIYWHKRTDNKAGWFYKNRDAYRVNGIMIEPGTTIKRSTGDGEVKDFVVPQSWEWELGLSRSEQETARRKLVEESIRMGERSGNTKDLVQYPINVVEKYLSILSEEKLIERGAKVRMQREREIANAKHRTHQTQDVVIDEKSFSVGTAVLEKIRKQRGQTSASQATS